MTPARKHQKNDCRDPSVILAVHMCALDRAILYACLTEARIQLSTFWVVLETMVVSASMFDNCPSHAGTKSPLQSWWLELES